MDLTDIVGVPVITALVYLLTMGYRYAVDGNAKLEKLTPIFAGLLGMILGIVAYFFAIELMPASNVLSAMLIGAISGLAATGGNQIYKQMTKGLCNDLTKTNDEKNDNADETNSKKID